MEEGTQIYFYIQKIIILLDVTGCIFERQITFTRVTENCKWKYSVLGPCIILQLNSRRGPFPPNLKPRIVFPENPAISYSIYNCISLVPTPANSLVGCSSTWWKQEALGLVTPTGKVQKPCYFSTGYFRVNQVCDWTIPPKWNGFRLKIRRRTIWKNPALAFVYFSGSSNS